MFVSSFADRALRALPAGIRGVGTMPVYEYGCGAGHRFEVTQKFSDRPITACQTCAQPVSKLISAPAIMFKGSGWYITDYSDKLKQTTDRKSTRLNSSHGYISYAVFCLKKKTN